MCLRIRLNCPPHQNGRGPTLIGLFALLAASCGGAAPSNDGDAMSDVWEAYYGFSIMDDGSLFPNESEAADPDRDGFNNLRESEEGSNPWVNDRLLRENSPLGYVRSGIEDPSESVTLYWMALLGKHYRIGISPDLLNWTDAVDPSGTPLSLAGSGQTLSLDMTPYAPPTDGDGVWFFRLFSEDRFTYSTMLSDWEYLLYTTGIPLSAATDMDSDGVQDIEDAAPLDSTVGALDVVITFPATGATIP